MNNRHLRCILVQSNHTHAKKELSHLILWKRTLRRNIALYHVGIHWFLSKRPFSLIKAIYLQLFVLRRKDLSLLYICDKIFFQKKIYIKSYIQITKIYYFLSFNIKLRINCELLGKYEAKIVLRTQFQSRVC